MGLEVLNNQIDELIIDAPNDFQNISNLIIPFSIIFRNNSQPDIYSGEESLSFIERDSKFQQILISEFISE